jgi:ABC-type transporter Mla MlaB component
MHYKITTEPHPAGRSVTLLLNGKFGEDTIPEIEKLIVRARCSHEKIFLDLSEVTLVDRKTVEYFSHASRDVTLVNCPVYLRRWITRGSDESEN